MRSRRSSSSSTLLPAALVDWVVIWVFAELSAGGSVTFRTTLDPETVSRAAPTVNVASIGSDQTEPNEGADGIIVSGEAAKRTLGNQPPYGL